MGSEVVMALLYTFVFVFPVLVGWGLHRWENRKRGTR